LSYENREIFGEKLKLGKLFRNRGKSETEGKCIIASEGMDAPDAMHKETIWVVIRSHLDK